MHTGASGQHFAAAGRSPRARERAKGGRPTTGSHNTLCKTRMRFATEKLFRFLFLEKGTKSPRDCFADINVIR